MSTVDLSETTSVKLDGAGAGIAKLGPLSAREVWRPGNVSVSANQNPTKEATCIIFVGDINTKAFRDNTFTGSSGDSTDKCNNDKLKKNEFVWASWTGGDANVTATLSVTGKKEI